MNNNDDNSKLRGSKGHSLSNSPSTILKICDESKDSNSNLQQKVIYNGTNPISKFQFIYKELSKAVWMPYNPETKFKTEHGLELVYQFILLQAKHDVHRGLIYLRDKLNWKSKIEPDSDKQKLIELKLLPLCPKDTLLSDVIELYSIMQAYWFEITSSISFMNLGHAFFTGLSAKINHSCDPNCLVVFNLQTDQYNSVYFELYTLREIHPGDEITFTYIGNIHDMIDRVDRQKKILSMFGFLCNCTYCNYQQIHDVEEENNRLKETLQGRLSKDQYLLGVEIEKMLKKLKLEQENNNAHNFQVDKYFEQKEDEVKYSLTYLRIFMGSHKDSDVSVWTKDPTQILYSMSTWNKLLTAGNIIPYNILERYLPKAQRIYMYDYVFRNYKSFRFNLQNVIRLFMLTYYDDLNTSVVDPDIAGTTVPCNPTDTELKLKQLFAAHKQNCCILSDLINNINTIFNISDGTEYMKLLEALFFSQSMVAEEKNSIYWKAIYITIKFMDS